jgi:hypothetical protein
LKRLLVISPYFPPINTADMQRVRMSLPYFKDLGWDAEVVVVQQKYTDLIKDPLLLKSIPPDIKIYQIKAFSKKWTSKFGLGSLALRAMWFYYNFVNSLLKKQEFDLIYFSTTEFPLCVLGKYWKKRFGIPYVIDMQDPWHTDYYKNKPKAERPKKYWFSYRLNKFLEPMAMKNADGLTSVSADYIKVLQDRYTHLKSKPTAVITFGAFDADFKIAEENDIKLSLAFPINGKQINLIYIGRGGHDMKPALSTLFTAFKEGLKNQPQLFNRIRMYFIGTSYASQGKGKPTISPIAEIFGLNDYVTEYTDRIGFYQSLKTLQTADGLVIIGSNQAAYTAFKIYPYILAKKPLVAILHQDSSATKIIKDCNAGFFISIGDNIDYAYNKMSAYIESIESHATPATNWKAFEYYTAAFMTKKQVDLFNKVV